jgi:L-threonylcarbamoyladenylate synthase
MQDFHDDLEHCLNVLQNGGIILYPTDTVWGIGCDATNPLAVQNIFDLKRRAEKKGMIILLADEAEISQYVNQMDPTIYRFIKNLTTPTTIILKYARGLAPNLISSDKTVGIRIVKEPFCQTLLKNYHKPIVSTSANISGEPGPAFFAQISQLIINGVDYVVRYRQEDQNPGKPSSIVKINTDGTAINIRP